MTSNLSSLIRISFMACEFCVSLDIASPTME
jgi:hypothetical protein